MNDFQFLPTQRMDIETKSNERTVNYDAQDLPTQITDDATQVTKSSTILDGCLSSWKLVTK